MDDIIPVSVMIFTLNEELHLPVCLSSLGRFDDIIVIDSFSNDETKNICFQQGVRFFQHAFEGFGTQRNWALSNTNPKHDWILILDADERVTEELAYEIKKRVVSANSDTGAFRVRRRFYMWGRWLRYSSLYPTWVVRLIHRDKVQYENRGHAETQNVSGEIESLQNDLIDENMKGIDEWFERQNRYARKEAEYEVKEQGKALRYLDIFSREPLKRRNTLKRLSWKIPLRPYLYFIYSYFFRKGFMDGRDGLVFCSMKALYQRMILIKKYDLKKVMRPY